MCRLNWRYLKPYIKLNPHNLAFLINQQCLKKIALLIRLGFFTGFEDKTKGGVGFYIKTSTNFVVCSNLNVPYLENL